MITREQHLFFEEKFNTVAVLVRVKGAQGE
jgi:hypothetical protein